MEIQQKNKTMKNIKLLVIVAAAAIGAISCNNQQSAESTELAVPVSVENVKKLISLLIINMYFNSLKRIPSAMMRRQSKSKKSIFWFIIYIRIFNMLPLVT